MEVSEGKTIYPAGNQIFNAFDKTPFDKVKVVIIGQDPYHGEGEAHGLCFSVQDGVTTLTVRKDSPNSHKDIGWQIFTDAVIKILSEKKEHLVFILWGAFAQQKKSLIDESKHYVICSAHPSPFSADRGFFGSKPFSKTNEYLEKNGITPINWEL